MDASLEPPSLSYPQLFSFQVSYTSRSDYRNSIIPEGSKKGEWRFGILEVDFQMETFFLQDRDRIFLSQTFSSFNTHAEVNSSDDCSLSLIFNSDQWEVASQNIAEKVCLQHILECITSNTVFDEVVRTGREKGIIGLDKNIIKHGRVHRKAINQNRLDDRYLVLCPGKLFVFKNFDVKGKHVRYVTSLLGATVRDDLTSWVEALSISIGYTKRVADASESNRKEEEKKPEIQLTKEEMVQRSSGCSNQYLSLARDERGASRISQQSHMIRNISPSAADSRPELVSLNSLAKNTVGCDAGESPQEIQSNTLLKQGFGQEDKENRDTRRLCSGKGSTNRQSRAMVYLENALDEMEVIVGSIRTTRRLGGAHHFDTLDIRRKRTGGLSPLRSSWDFDWNRKEEQSWKGREAYMERKWREREQFMRLGPGTKARSNDKVPKLNAWKPPVLQLNKDWQSDRNNRSRESGTSQVRHSVDGISTFNRNREFPGIPKLTNYQHDQSQERMIYSGLSLPSAGRPSTTSASTSSKVQLSPASENLLKKYSGEVSVAETNNLSRCLQMRAVSGINSRDADSRQIAVNQQPNIQLQRMKDCSAQPYITTASSTSEDEEEDDIEEDEEGNEIYSRSTIRPGSNIRGIETALPDGFSSRQDGNDLREQHCEGRGPSADLTFAERASLDPKGSLTDTQCTSQHDDSSNRHHNQAWPDVASKSATQQSRESSISNGFYESSDTYIDAKTKYPDVLMEPTTPKVRGDSQSDQTFVSCIKASDRKTLEDPIYDPNFTGPQIINRRPNRFSQHSFDGNADVRKGTENVGYQSNLLTAHAPSYFSETTQKHHATELFRNQLPSNVYEGETVLPCRGQEGAEFSAQSTTMSPSLHRRQQTNFVRQTEGSGCSPSLQQGQITSFDHGLSHINELPELVNRISRITAAFDNRDQQGSHTGHERAAIVVDQGHGHAAAYNMQLTGQDTTVDLYQQFGKSSSLPGAGLVRGIQQSSSNPCSVHGTPFRDAYGSSQSQSKT